MIDQEFRSLRNIGRQIADPFQVRVNLEHGCNASQIDRNRLMQCEHLQALFFNLHVAAVNIVVACQHLICQVTTPFA